MRMLYDSEYEKLTKEVFRKNDVNNFCLLTEGKGENIKESIIDAHWHEWLELIYVIEGGMQLEYPSGTMQVNAGEVALIGVQTLHKIVGTPGKFSFICLHVNFGLIIQYLNPSLFVDQTIKIQKTANFIMLIERVNQLLNSTDAVSTIRLKSSILEILANSIEELELTQLETNNQTEDLIDEFSKIIFYIGEYYRENITLGHLSEKFGYTAQYLSALFKKRTGINFHTYLTGFRLEKVKFLLLNSDKTLLEIAIDSGFSSEHSLINNFKKVFEMTPTEYRSVMKEKKPRGR